MSQNKSRIYLLNRIAQFIRERGEVPLAIVALKFRYSYKHFKYAILPELLALFDNIIVIRRNGREFLVYRGNTLEYSAEYEKEIEREARKEAEEVLEAAEG